MWKCFGLFLSVWAISSAVVFAMFLGIGAPPKGTVYYYFCESDKNVPGPQEKALNDYDQQSAGVVESKILLVWKRDQFSSDPFEAVKK